MSGSRQSLGSLARNSSCDPCDDPCAAKKHHHKEGYGYGGMAAWGIFGWIILAIIIWLIIIAVKPEWAQKKDCHNKCGGEVDFGRALLGAIVISFIIIIIIWVIAAAAGYGRGGHHSY